MKVSDAEFEQGPAPSRGEWVTTAQALGMALSMRVPLITSFAAVGEITPNPRIRRILAHVHPHTRKYIADFFTVVGSRADGDLIVALCDGETTGTLDLQLLQYAADKGIQPHQVAQQAGRSEEVQKLTGRLAYYLNEEFPPPIIRILRAAHRETKGEFRTLLAGIIDYIERGGLLNEALKLYYPHTFDLLYVEMIKAGEPDAEFDRAFKLLAQS